MRNKQLHLLMNEHVKKPLNTMKFSSLPNDQMTLQHEDFPQNLFITCFQVIDCHPNIEDQLQPLIDRST